ncbi:MAG: hypothetical protein ACP5MD_10195, partial [Verrucomicrobiia bacterium]
NDDLMSASLPVSTRRLPSAIDAAIINSVWESLESENLAAGTVTFVPGARSAMAGGSKIGFVQFAGAIPVGLGAAPLGIVNGKFGVNDPEKPEFGWHAFGAAAVANGQGKLTESASLMLSDFVQTFVLPEETRALRFTIASLTLSANGSAPADAFEVALLRSDTLAPATGRIPGWPGTDALLNIQADGTVRFADGVTVRIGGAQIQHSGDKSPVNQPAEVTVDLSGLGAGTPLSLFIDLIAFGVQESAVAVDNVLLVQRPPTVLTWSVNDGEVQRSKVTSITIQFSSNVADSLEAGDLELTNVTTGTAIPASALNLTYDAQNSIARWTFPTFVGQSLPDGNYRLRLRAATVTDDAGQRLDANGPDMPGEDVVESFFRYYGDTDGDRDVDFYDLWRFQQTYARSAGDELYNPALDYDSDGRVDSIDMAAYSSNYLKSLAPPALLRTSGTIQSVPSSLGFGGQKGRSLTLAQPGGAIARVKRVVASKKCTLTAACQQTAAAAASAASAVEQSQNQLALDDAAPRGTAATSSATGGRQKIGLVDGPVPKRQLSAATRLVRAAR